MSTNHNRIRVEDLEKNQPNKILITNQNGELEFNDINNLQDEKYNALDCTIEGKALDARQGKVLKDMINNINVPTMPLINNLTAGGTNKALTAEMGKTLENTKLTASLATDPETQISSAITEDNKVISRSKLFNWWKWIENTVMHKSGNETFSGIKSSTNTGTSQINGLSLINSATGSGQVLSVKNTDTGIGVRLTNTGSNAAKALYVDNIANGRGISMNNQGIGTAQVFNSTLTSTGNLLEFQKNNVITSKFDQNGILTTPNFILSNNKLTTIPQNGAIERDLKGNLYHVANSSRYRILDTRDSKNFLSTTWKSTTLSKTWLGTPTNLNSIYVLDIPNSALGYCDQANFLFKTVDGYLIYNNPYPSNLIPPKSILFEVFLRGINCTFSGNESVKLYGAERTDIMTKVSIRNYETLLQTDLILNDNFKLGSVLMFSEMTYDNLGAITSETYRKYFLQSLEYTGDDADIEFSEALIAIEFKVSTLFDDAENKNRKNAFAWPIFDNYSSSFLRL